MTNAQRLAHLTDFYKQLDILEEKCPKTEFSRITKNDYPYPGVFFVFEPGEMRSKTGQGCRVVHVGRTKLPTGSNNPERFLGKRLVEHRDGDVNSSFRQAVETALVANTSKATVSTYIKTMWVLCLKVEQECEREEIKRCALALLSNWQRPQKLDEPSPQWRGDHSNRPDKAIKDSGLWNIQDIKKQIADSEVQAFLATLTNLVSAAAACNDNEN